MRSPRSSCSGHCTPATPSKPRSPTERPDARGIGVPTTFTRTWIGLRRGDSIVSPPKDAPTLSKPLDQNMMREATRLVRAGRLAESTALLQHLLGGTAAP